MAANQTNASGIISPAPVEGTTAPGHVLTSEETNLLHHLFGIIQNIRKGKSNVKLDEVVVQTNSFTDVNANFSTERILSLNDDGDLDTAESVFVSTVLPLEAEPESTTSIQLSTLPPNEHTQTTELYLADTTTQTTTGTLFEGTTTSTVTQTEGTTFPPLSNTESTTKQETTESEKEEKMITEWTSTPAGSFTKLPLHNDPVISLLISTESTGSNAETTTVNSQSKWENVQPTTAIGFAVLSNETSFGSTAGNIFLETTTSTSTTTEPNSVSTTTSEEAIQLEEVTLVTEEPTRKSNEQFMFELIALRERQRKMEDNASQGSTTPASELLLSSTTTNSPRAPSEAVSTSVSVEVEVNAFVSLPAQSVLFAESTTAPSVASVPQTTTEYIPTTTAKQERENRKLPFAIYDNAINSKPHDEGRFMATFQDFYSGTVDISFLLIFSTLGT